MIPAHPRAAAALRPRAHPDLMQSPMGDLIPRICHAIRRSLLRSVIGHWSLGIGHWARLLAVLLALLPGAALRADHSVSVPIDPGTGVNAKIDLIEPLDRWDGFGFMPVDVRIQNDDSASHEWQVDFQVRVYGRPGSTLHAPFTFTVGARRTTETIRFMCRDREPRTIRVERRICIRTGGAPGSTLKRPTVQVIARQNYDPPERVGGFARTLRPAAGASGRNPTPGPA